MKHRFKKKDTADDLWALHIAGTGSMIAAPSFEAADAAADQFNRDAGALDDDGDIKPGTTIYAQPEGWPHGAESHAHSLRRDWPEYGG